MSYRSFKRVLGETSLERKCRFLFGACLLLLITGSFWWYGRQTERLVKKQNREQARLLVDTEMILIHWEKFPKSSENSETVASDLVKNLQNQQFTWGSIKPDDASATGKYRPKDLFEEEVLAKFVHSKGVQTPAPANAKTAPEASIEATEENSADRYLPERKLYQYYQPVYAKSQVCVSCHKTLDNKPNMSEGDLVSVVRITMSDRNFRSELNWNRAILLSTAIITVFLAMVAAYVIVRYVIVKPLKHLRDVSDAISHGDLKSRAEIRTGDEFEELGVAFNRMLRHLVAAQEDARQMNNSLDRKVDELAQANMRLFEMNRLKSDFLATMSHELRTPLNSIIGFSDVLGSIKSLDDKQRRYVQNIQKSGKMLLDMINDILDLAKIESGKMEVRLADFKIDHVIVAQCDMARPLTEKKNIDLEIEIARNLPEMHQDMGKVQQILNNLLSNAIKFTPEGGRIIVQARRGRGGDLEMIVTDTGVGIAEEDQANIFEKFRQGEIVLPTGDAMTREFSGTGLGLSIVKELCRLLGGEISLESELGKGSAFTVRLPFVRADQPRLDSPLSDSLDQLTKPRRVDFEREPTVSTTAE
jgi:signal transduction histidine kinase